jgi:hypothetical protein
MDKAITETEWEKLRASRWRAAEAERVLAAWRASGKTVSAFARSHRVDPQRLYWWKKQQQEWKGERASEPTMVPAVLAIGHPGVNRSLETSAAPQVTLRVGVELVVEVREAGAVAPDWLSALVQGLGGRR